MGQTANTVREAVDFDGSFADKLGAAVRGKLGALRGLVSEGVIDATVGKVVDAAARRLDSPLADLLTSAWEKYPEVQELCDARKHPSDEETIAELAQHKFGWSYQPQIEIAVNDMFPFTIALKVDVGVTVKAGVLVVQGGKFKELRSGKIGVGASLAVAGEKIASREQDVDLPAVIHFAAAEESPAARRDAVPVGKIAAPPPEPAVQ